MSTNLSLLMIMAFLVMSSLAPAYGQSLNFQSDQPVSGGDNSATSLPGRFHYERGGVPGRRVGGGSR